MSPSSSLHVLLEKLSVGLDALGVGLCLCERDGAFRFQSARAQELLGPAGADDARDELAAVAHAAVDRSPHGPHTPQRRLLRRGSDVALAAVVVVPEGAVVVLCAAHALHEGETFPGAYGLTGAEEAVACLLLKRMTNKEIAAELGVSHHTVKHHVERILRKLGVRSRKEVAGVLRDWRGGNPATARRT